jgi:hypothetical protein
MREYDRRREGDKDVERLAASRRSYAGNDICVVACRVRGLGSDDELSNGFIRSRIVSSGRFSQLGCARRAVASVSIGGGM